MDVTCDLLYWITIILAFYVGWFEIPRDFIRLPELYGLKWEFDHSGDCFCACALIIWTVLLQLASEQDSTLNMSYIFKTKVFVCKSQF
jgi:hypothetical protein